ncbi:molecular chaperone DnaJ [Halobacteriales archaeon QS_1_68_20]|nr:MAG: molecular chaperone DnaJ [Halobacteriales archaeon QS_1_68_20]
MNRSPLILGLAAVFAGLTTILLGAGAATGSWFVLFVALPLGITTVIMWLHGTGRLRASLGRRTASARFDGRGPRRGAADQRAEGGQRGANAGRRRAPERTAGDGPFAGGHGPFTGNRGRFSSDGGRFGGARRRRTAAGGGQRTRGRSSAVQEGMSAREAATVLGVDPGADEATVKRAYREKVKRHHPDVEGGDEATFKRVTEAYERLT